MTDPRQIVAETNRIRIYRHARQMADGDLFQPNIKKISRDMGLSRQQIRGALAHFIGRGVMEVARVGSQKRATRYRILRPLRIVTVPATPIAPPEPVVPAAPVVPRYKVPAGGFSMFSAR